MAIHPLATGISVHDLERLIRVEHRDPHSILGAHPFALEGCKGVVIRAFHPDAVRAEVLIKGRNPVSMELCHPGGLFACFVPRRRLPLRYRLRFHFNNGSTWESDAPYRFLPTLGETDLYLAGEGTHYRLYDKLGAHLRTMDSVSGVSFAVWAPNAMRVSVVGSFNGWDGRLFPMRAMGASGIWEIFVPELGPGTLYKYEIKTASGHLRIKADPFAFASELRPATASVVWDINAYSWRDTSWMARREKRDWRHQPMAIYEVHLGSWMRVPDEQNRWMTYRELAPKLVRHVKKFGFTHVELMPVAEHPLDASWGYQVTGYYAPTSRYGTPDDFKFLVDTCHRNGIGVILDWVPAHFPKDDWSLRLFDGTALYEHADPREGEHVEWGTLIFNFGRHEVRNFLIANALFWLDKYHIDALRVDAVASMLYLDYGKQNGQWIPNRYGGNENLEAIAFFRQLHEALYRRFPGCFTVAEESTAWSGVTVPAYAGGLGFGFKWDMGWMHDTLLYFSKDPVHRKHHHNNLTFSMVYAYSENFILPFSHDEVVYGKGSLLRKMPGDEWQRFANLRLLIAYMYTHPGKKLLFMGTELASWDEWDYQKGLDWNLGSDPMRQKFQRFLQDLGEFYHKARALWELDPEPEGFAWIDCNDAENSVVSYVRLGKKDHLVCVLNLTPVPRHGYRIGVPNPTGYRERINSDSKYYGGSNLGNLNFVKADKIPMHGFDQSICLTLPPLACLILEPGRKKRPKKRSAG
ncbi:MAG: 1,4-alpha-glucan branching protein GlgB [Deltaproteobacteria bacterium]|nr:1,4-alpha-glucan branching protein GlgB [Deltaproteobacteria bacterium]